MTDKFIFRFVAAISVFVLVVVIILGMKILPTPDVLPSFVPFLPKLNAIINGTCSVLLLISLYFILNGNVLMHKRVNILAFCLSALFLVSYIIYHWLAPSTRFGDLDGDGGLSEMERGAVGNILVIYRIILISHIILAAGVLPLILLSFYRGLQMQVEKHKKLVRWTFPIWLYVTVTGVIVYILVSPYYHF